MHAIDTSNWGGHVGKEKYLLTGPPGSGKSTVMSKCVKQLRTLDITVGGISTPEIRRDGRRVGFSVIDLVLGRRGILAGTNMTSRFRVGRYGVDVKEFESVALPALDYAERECDVICVDEIGRMELFSDPFRRRLEVLLLGDKPMIAVVHRGYMELYGGCGTLFYISRKNRELIPRRIVEGIRRSLEERRTRNLRLG
jgi:nucleoside-triphosphatase